MIETAPPINEAVALLDRFAPKALEALRDQFPELGPHLEAGGLAGPADPQLIARARVCIETVKQVDRLCKAGLANSQKRLQTQRRLVLVGGATATFASASVVASLAAKYPTVAFVAGIVSLIGSLAALLSEYFGRVPHSGMSLFAVYSRLAEVRSDAILLRSEIEIRLAHDPQDEDEKEIAKLIGKGNGLFRSAYELLSMLEMAADFQE